MKLPRGFNAGGGRDLPSAVREPNVPQHEIDVRIAQTALRSLKVRQGACAASGGRGSRALQALCQMLMIAKGCARSLSKDPWSTLSAGQRRALLRMMPREDAERLSRPGVVETPPALMNLPKRPPVARKAGDSDE